MLFTSRPSVAGLAAGLMACAAAVTVSVAAAPAGATTAQSAGNAVGMSPSSIVVTPSIIRANEKTAFDYFVSKGLTKKQAAGVVGNLDQESQMDPNAKQPGGAGRGIAQWSVGGRWDTYSGDNEVHYTNTVLGVSRYNLTGQLKFTWHELSDFSNYGLSELKKTTTIDSAVVVFQNKFEGCGDCRTSTRESYAHDAYDRYA